MSKQRPHWPLLLFVSLICAGWLINPSAATAQVLQYGCYIASPPHAVSGPGDVRIVSGPADCVPGETWVSWEVFPVGLRPGGIAFDGTNVWVVNNGAGSVTKLRASDGANLGTFPAGPGPAKAIFDGTHIWITNRGANTLTKLRASDGGLVATIPVRQGPAGLAFDGTSIWVSYYLNNSVSRIRPSDGVELANTPGVSSPLEVLYDGTNIWAANNTGGGMVTKINATTGAILGVFNTNGGFPSILAFDGSNVWVPNSGTQSLSKIRASDGAYMGAVPMGFGSAGITFDGQNIWVANEAVVLKFRPSDGALLGSFPGSFNGSGLYTISAVFDGRYVWVANFTANTVTRYRDGALVEPQIVSSWTMDGDIVDSVDSNNPSAMNATNFEPGQVCQGVKLGQNGYIEIPDSPSLQNQRFSVTAWVRPDGPGPNNDLFGSTFIQKNLPPPTGDNGGSMGMWWSAVDNRFRFSIGNVANVVTSADTFPAGQFYHVSGTYDGTNLKLFVNGELQAQRTVTITIPYHSPIPWTIGSSDSYYRSVGYPRTFNGVIDEVRIYNGALDATEIDALYNGTGKQCPSSDAEAPTTNYFKSPDANGSGWNNSDVSISLSASDNVDGSGVSDITYCATGAQTVPCTTVSGDAANLLITAEGETAITYFAKDNADNTEATQTLVIKIDKSAPSVSCGSADGLWHASDVAIPCSADDGVSGLADSSDSSFDLTTRVAANTETANASTDNRAVCDVADNCATTGPVGGNKVDKKAPTITITTPAANAVYLLNQSVSANYTCTDGGSGVGSCSGTTADGGQLETAAAGANTFTVNATDNVGNTASPSVVNYTVGFGIQVLFDQTRAHKSGSTVPIKVRLVDVNGATVSSAATIVHAVSVVQTGSETSPNVEDAGNANPDLDFRYDASLGGYIFNLKTTGYATGSYQLNFIAGNGPTMYSVGFQVRQ